MRTLFFVFFATALLLPAQTKRPRKPAAATTPAPAPMNPDAWPLANITIMGNRNYTAGQVLAVAGVKVGQTSSKAELEAAHARLMASGGFESVAYHYEPAAGGKGVNLTYELQEVNTFYPMMFEELPVPDAEIRDFLMQEDPLFGAKISATKEALEHYTKLISDYLAKTKNYHEPLVSRLSSENPPDLVILVRPATPRASVAQVTALNTGDIVQGVVQSTLYGVAVGSIYSEPRIRQLLDSSIRPLYEARGHLRVAFSDISAEPAKDVKGVAVTFKVEQGPVYTFGKLKFTGTDTAQDELTNLTKIKTGALADFDLVKAAQSHVADYYRHNGFMRCNTEVARTLHDKEKTVDVNIKIDTGPLYTFRSLTITGLDIISEPVVRKLWGLKEGKPFNPDYPDHFLERIKEEGLFDNLKGAAAERKTNPDDHTVDVTLIFQGGKAPVDDAEKRRRQPL